MAVITHKDGTAAAVLSSNQIKQTEKALQQYEEDNAEAMAQLVTDFTADLQNLQEQIDASITSWFYTSDPSTNTPPASDWTTDQQKADHVGDLYYNKTSGDGWRWQYVSDHYDWVAVMDQKVLDALYAASKSQDTIDSKRRVFYNTPVTPYDRGDLWVQGSQGDILRADVARTASESYTQADWILASKYTDDTAADAAYDLAEDAYDLAEDANEANKYINIISGQTGISVHMANDTRNYALMNTAGFYVYQSSEKKAHFSDSGMSLFTYYNMQNREVEVFDINVDADSSYTSAELISKYSSDNYASVNLYAYGTYGAAILRYRESGVTKQVSVTANGAFANCDFNVAGTLSCNSFSPSSISTGSVSCSSVSCSGSVTAKNIDKGSTSITPSSANTPTSKSVSFNKTFSSAPQVVVTPESTVAGTTLTGWAVTDITTTGFKAWVTRTNTTSTTLHWIAIG